MSHTHIENAAKRMARLAAVQGLYQIFLTSVKAENVIAHFKYDPSAFNENDGEKSPPSEIDQALFVDIVSGVASHMDEINGLIAGALDPKLSVDRLEILLRAILAAGVFELYHHANVSSGVIINDYVDVAHTFFDNKEPGFVNAVLDKLAKNLRAA